MSQVEIKFATQVFTKKIISYFHQTLELKFYLL